MTKTLNVKLVLVKIVASTIPGLLCWHWASFLPNFAGFQTFLINRTDTSARVKAI